MEIQKIEDVELINKTKSIGNIVIRLTIAEDVRNIIPYSGTEGLEDMPCERKEANIFMANLPA